MPIERRRFMVKAGGVLAVGAAVAQAPNVIAQPKFQWRMSTTWPPVLDVLHDSARQLARLVDERSPLAKRVHASFTRFQTQLAGWSRISEGAYHQFVAL